MCLNAPLLSSHVLYSTSHVTSYIYGERITHLFWNINFKCNFGPKDKYAIMPHDMQMILKLTQQDSKEKQGIVGKR